ncbi:phage major tail tube protein [Brevibacillus ruminantium]|uniref:Phage major tail tube protein n=1 Tax=Brevibacillus ruminantium TaxID=2950604 RepID=A0ABY4WMU3_9BACL|nr:phage major tail tube protein [Brevibacillus ruminantium]USG67448.1 phage major tail tube protein [Brevibacillus ruminantium]
MAVNTVPERLINFRVYVDGSNDLKGVADIQLPSFESMTETVSGAGIAGEYESPTIGHFQSMKLTLNWRTVTKDMISLLRQKAQRFDCRGAFQVYDAASGQYKTQAVRVVVQGPPTKVEPGKLEANGSTDGVTEIEVLYLKLDIDGKNQVEIDKLNYITVIDGVDYLADVRQALGL